MEKIFERMMINTPHDASHLPLGATASTADAI